jgi:hypothetical protein
MHTHEYEHFLELDPVLGVVADDDNEDLEIRVTDGTLKADILPPDFDCPYEVVIVEEAVSNDQGAYQIQLADETTTGMYRQSRGRSVMEGVSEGHKDSTAGTAGPYVARVTDTSQGEWASDVSEAQLVRLSNNHVYAQSNEAELGDEILQPGPLDGGQLGNDTIGKLAGYLPVEDGAKADVAARTVDRALDNPRPLGLPETYGQSIHRGPASELKGETVVNTGRTLGVRWADVGRTGASINVGYGDDRGSIRLRNQVISGNMAEGGQSGSAVYREKTGALCGILFAASDSSTIFTHVNQIEANFGIKFEPHGDSYDGVVSGGFADGMALPTDRTVKIEITVSNKSHQPADRVAVGCGVPDGWTIESVSNGELYTTTDTPYIHLRGVAGGGAQTTTVSIHAGDNVAPDNPASVAIEIPSGNGIDYSEELPIQLAPDVISYYKAGGPNDGIGGDAKVQAINDFRAGRLPARIVTKIISY